MKNLLLLFMISTMVTSCNSQTDLESLKFDTDVSSIINVKDTTKFKKNKTLSYGLVAYTTDDIDNFRYANVNFSNLSIKDDAKNSLIRYTSDLSFYVDNFNSNKLSGIKIKIENESEGKILLNYMKTKLGNPLMKNIDNEDNHLESSYLWDDEKRNQLVYVTQDTKYFSGEKNRFISTEVSILKRGMKLTPDEGNNPETIKKILKENPNAFDVLEILKSRFY